MPKIGEGYEALRALIDDTIKGLLRSIGDPGANPTNATGKTVLALLSQVYDSVYQMARAPNWAILTTTPLDANASFTSSSFDLSSYEWRHFIATVYADQAGTLYVEQSPDGTNWDISESLSVSAGVGASLEVVIKSRYVRVRYVNGATAQSVFRLARRVCFC
jgi:hypothetical protein